MKTGDVYPLSDFNAPNTEVEEGKAVLRKMRTTNYEDMDEDDDEITPFYKPGYKEIPRSSQLGLLQGHANTRV